MVVVGRWRLDAALYSWDPSQQIQGLKYPSQPNPNKNNIETCSVKLPIVAIPRLRKDCEHISKHSLCVKILFHILSFGGIIFNSS